MVLLETIFCLISHELKTNNEMLFRIINVCSWRQCSLPKMFSVVAFRPAKS